MVFSLLLFFHIGIGIDGARIIVVIYGKTFKASNHSNFILSCACDVRRHITFRKFSILIIQ